MSSPTTGPDLKSWYASVAGVLAKASRKDPADMPDDAWRSLIATTLDGVDINPLYTRNDELPEQPQPGQFPFVRGGNRAGLPDSGWHVSERVDTSGDAQDVNTRILGLLGEGVSSLWLRGADGDLAAILKGVYLDLAPLTFDAGTALPTLVTSLMELLDARSEAGDGVGNRADIVVDLAATPLTAGYGADIAESISLTEAVSLAQQVNDRPETIRTFVADGTVFHDAGAGDAQELAYAIAAGLDYVRALMEAGMSAQDALTQVSFRLSATDDQFQSIAKLRAGRLMWARVAGALGAPEAGNAPQHAVTSAAMMTRRDPWVNMLRVTLAAFGAGVGGATSVTVNAFDSSIPGGLDNTSKSFSSRMARNTQLLLLEESHLGHVVDPAGGSWYVESLTESIAQAAWEIVQNVESHGGLAAALAAGIVDNDIERTRTERDTAIAHRTYPVTGVSEFPNMDEPPLDASRRGGIDYRYGLAFEQLRDRSDAHLEATGHRPTVMLAGLGPQAETTPRITFAANLLGAGGISAVNPQVTAADQYADAANGAQIAVLCGADKRYATEGVEAVTALRAAGVHTVYVAGKSRGFPDDPSAQPDGFLALGIDAVAHLTTILDQLGVQ